MKIYVMTTGALFGLLAAVHVWRMAVERHLATDPWYLLITAAAAGLSLWAWRVIWLSKRPTSIRGEPHGRHPIR